ncbi:MAG: NUDIX hydrolase [Patescibacteria group bacterium]|nr:NUDIX hydrolase [Patescibacteria group bacterium]
MKILAGVLIEDRQGRILCGVRNVPDKPYYGYLATPWGRAEGDEDPYSTAVREANEELAGQVTEFTMGRVSACAPTNDGHMLYLFRAGLTGKIELNRHSAELVNLEWLYPDQIRHRSMAVPVLLEILDILY